ncbi:hypothetical protein HanPI659440_Chr07g0259011 [Helianthus annuus]|nr:hypothetical protein HanPI659440_Chr07g0259011 [Helianthus annuus]
MFLNNEDGIRLKPSDLLQAQKRLGQLSWYYSWTQIRKETQVHTRNLIGVILVKELVNAIANVLAFCYFPFFTIGHQLQHNCMGFSTLKLSNSCLFYFLLSKGGKMVG